jgi:predicted ATPase with chaperone activity
VNEASRLARSCSLTAHHERTQTTSASQGRRSDHHRLLRGLLGASTSRLARGLTTMLPLMSLAKAIEATCIHRIAGLTGARTAVVTARPYRAPHQTISDVGLIGGG